LLGFFFGLRRYFVSTFLGFAFFDIKRIQCILVSCGLIAVIRPGKMV
jgi:hypothetical protein